MSYCLKCAHIDDFKFTRLEMWDVILKMDQSIHFKKNLVLLNYHIGLERKPNKGRIGSSNGCRILKKRSRTKGISAWEKARPRTGREQAMAHRKLLTLLTAEAKYEAIGSSLTYWTRVEIDFLLLRCFTNNIKAYHWFWVLILHSFIWSAISSKAGKEGHQPWYSGCWNKILFDFDERRWILKNRIPFSNACSSIGLTEITLAWMYRRTFYDCVTWGKVGACELWETEAS